MTNALKEKVGNKLDINTTQDVEITIVVDGEISNIDSTNLGVTGNGFPGTWETLEEGCLQFSDRSYVLTNIPSQFIGLKYFRGPCHTYTVSLSTGNIKGKIYVFASYGNSSTRRNSLENAFLLNYTTKEQFANMNTTSFGAVGFEMWSFLCRPNEIVIDENYPNMIQKKFTEDGTKIK